MSLGITEREVVAELAAELAKMLQTGGMPFTSATVEHSAGGLYPDIVIWQDESQQKAFAIWELKRPNLQEDLSKLPAKAARLGVRYVVVWNFAYGELYQIDGLNLRSLKSYPVLLLASLDEWAIRSKRIAVIEQARRMLEDLARLAKGEILTPYVPDKLYFIGILQKAVHLLMPVLEKHLLERKRDKQVRARIEQWAVKQGYPLALPNLDEMLARHWAYSLAVRILFYFTVRRYYPGLPDPRPAPAASSRVADVLRDAFAKAQAVDWQAVFEPSPLDDLGLPPNADPILHELLDDFHRFDFGQLKEDVIGQIMEGLIPEEERHNLGQYFTPENVVDFIIGFVAHDWDGHYLDPTCGSGTFLNRLYSRLRWLSAYSAGHADLLAKLWGVDIAHFPAELASINLFRQDVRDVSNFPRIIVQDFFRVAPGQSFDFPPLRAAPNYQKIRVKMPAFRGIVGNFPYIRQELIDSRNKGYKVQIVQAIAEDWFWKDRELFTVREFTNGDLNHIAAMGTDQRRQWLQEQVAAGKIDLRLSAQADIYAYLFYHAGAFLEEGGRLGIVTSNSWLDVAYGLELKRFFLRHFKIIAVVASWAEPWFQDAAINTAFVILERCENPRERSDNVVRFVKVKKPLEQLLPQDLLLQEPQRWQAVDALVRQIENAPAQIAGWDPATGQVQSLQGIQTLETDALRIRLVPQSYLEEDLEKKGASAKWGLYIRAPQVYFDILEQAGNKLVPLRQVVEVRRGYTTGINDFFYLEVTGPGSAPGTVQVRNARGWVGELEERCLQPVIKSPKEAKGLVVDPSALKYRLFLPPAGDVADPEQVLRRDYPLAWQYVQWGARQRTPQGIPWPQVPSVQGRKAWWLLGETCSVDFILNRFIDKRYFAPGVELALVSDTFFVGTVGNSRWKAVYQALINSSLYALEAECKGRVNLGDGLLTFYGPDILATLVPDVTRFPEQAEERILLAYDRLKVRPVKPIAEEVKQADRRALDEAVLEALGLDPQKYLPQIYSGLVQMVKERLALPKMRQLRRKTEQQLSMKEITERITSAVLPNGLRPVRSFLPAGRVAMMRVPVTGRPAAWQVFFTEFHLVDADGNKVGVIQNNEYQARYVIYAARAGEFMVEVPAEPVAAGKAVQGYEQYLREVAKELLEQALQMTKDYKQAERITREILESFDLPKLAVETALAG